MKTRKKKINPNHYADDWREHNRTMRRKHMHFMVFKELNDYIAYRFGKSSIGKKSSGSYAPVYNHRKTAPVHSLTDSGKVDSKLCTTSRKESQKYSGTYVVGVAQMHKSNGVAIGRGDDPESYAKMRRN